MLLYENPLWLAQEHLLVLQLPLQLHPEALDGTSMLGETLFDVMYSKPKILKHHECNFLYQKILKTYALHQIKHAAKKKQLDLPVGATGGSSKSLVAIMLIASCPLLMSLHTKLKKIFL